MQDRKSMLTQTIDKIITQKIEEADCNIKPDQSINKLEIGKGFKTYIEKLDQDYDFESDFDLYLFADPQLKILLLLIMYKSQGVLLIFF